MCTCACACVRVQNALVVPIMRHQKMALAWMCKREISSNPQVRPLWPAGMHPLDLTPRGTVRRPVSRN